MIRRLYHILQKGSDILVEKIKKICKERKVPISRLEEDLGFTKGYIYKLEKSSPSVDNAKKIADYLKIPINKLVD